MSSGRVFQLDTVVALGDISLFVDDGKVSFDISFSFLYQYAAGLDSSTIFQRLRSHYSLFI